MKNKIEKYLSLLLKEGIKGYNHFRIFEIMNGFFSKEKESYENSEVFVNMSIRAHLDLSFYHLFKIYDTQKNSINIFKFLKEIESNKNIFNLDLTSEIKNDNNTLKNLKPIENMRSLRNNYYSHLGGMQIFEKDDLFEKFPIFEKEIKDLYMTAENILNKYSNYFNGGQICFEFAPTQLEKINTHFEFVEDAYNEERSNRVEKLKSKYIT